MSSGSTSKKIPEGTGFFKDILFKFRLMLRLIGDNRVDMLLKLIPISTLIYLIMPLDFLFGPIDDAVVIYAGMELFIQLCPQEVVNEHMLVLKGSPSSDKSAEQNVIDAGFKSKE